MNAYIYKAALICDDCYNKLVDGFDTLEPFTGTLRVQNAVVLGAQLEDSAFEIRDRITVRGGRIYYFKRHAPLVCPGDPNDEGSFDSDDYPKGPYRDGGGESDCPQHCDHCNTFLENPLTEEGEEYVRQAVAENPTSPAIEEWGHFYGYFL
jgi:hypothetical protein